jgi:hypothetical protein
MKDEDVEDTLTIVLIEKRTYLRTHMLTNFETSSWRSKSIVPGKNVRVSSS